MVRRKLVAQRAGVSEATVSRVLNGVDGVKEGTRKKVLEAVEALGYRPNAIAQSFVKGRSGNIGVIVPHIPQVHLFSTHYFGEISSGIAVGLSKYRLHMLLLFYQSDDPDQVLHAFESRKIDGCIVLGANEKTRGIESLKAAGCPVCFVSHRDEDPLTSYVDTDNVNGAYLATSHLIKSGHERIAFLNGPLMYTNSVDRLEGFQKALADAGMHFDPALVLQGNYSRTSGYAAVAHFLAINPIPTSVFVANDRMAAGFILGLREVGLRVGQHVSLVGYDDADIATITDPPLTTIRVPFFEMGKRAASILVEKIGRGESSQGEKIRLPAELIVRESSQSVRQL
ncbi:LacI family DNA-binding transcriptional regulator [Alicyclobacillus fastidiosus]|uniref:LacI family DNA-binding transcriptional regulator n=1 Tax=Alicyclobacillus fastidiosus TaxID=392011 RepID=A0ABV5AJY3_9BACL|nr:LacI family DNA-binding transcriptional regulator [Alicyclobacillus fastidiosus]WEH08273.1 LacI family DNA-binding transcriptional regulator [Alicyclobacillus fastidiosus]